MNLGNTEPEPLPTALNALRNLDRFLSVTKHPQVIDQSMEVLWNAVLLGKDDHARP